MLPPCPRKRGTHVCATDRHTSAPTPCIVMTFLADLPRPLYHPPCQVWRLAPGKHGVRLCWNHHSPSLSGRQKVVRLHRARFVWQCNAQYSRRVVNTQKNTPAAHHEATKIAPAPSDEMLHGGWINSGVFLSVSKKLAQERLALCFRVDIQDAQRRCVGVGVEETGSTVRVSEEADSAGSGVLPSSAKACD
jgi:hypothetical protein